LKFVCKFAALQQGVEMKRKWKILIILIWIILIIILGKYNIITFDMVKLKGYLQANGKYAMVIFLLLWIVRLLIFIPGTVFMILGGIYFGPVSGFFLSLIGIIASETIVYLIAKTFLGEKLKVSISKKYPKIGPMLDIYNHKFLALGILCPIAPAYAVTILTVTTGISYMKFILTDFLANIPLILMYSLIGISFTKSVYSMALISITIIIFVIFSINIWNKLMKKANLN
jgi:uncharacterized membrane protein YdjX (TVP38/TMEM64 family)